MKICFCGDIMPGGVLPYQKVYLTDRLATTYQSFDLRIGTLESPIGTNLPFDENKMKGRANIIYARDEDFYRIKGLGIDIVSLANNHIYDLGEEGLKNTIRILQENNILYFGAGMNANEAARPVLIRNEGRTIAIFGYCMYGNPYIGHVQLATSEEPGVNPLDLKKVVSDIKEAKRKYDYVIIMPHWGIEYRYEPMDECVMMAKQMIKAGADAVIGSHTHQIQPVVKYKSGIIAYSLGNFLFPDFYMSPPRPIWYPSASDIICNIPEVVGYPFPITQPIKQIWKDEARIGSIVGLNISDKIQLKSFNHVKLSKDNILGLYQLPKKDYHRLKYIGLITNYPKFGIILSTINKIRIKMTQTFFSFINK